MKYVKMLGLAAVAAAAMMAFLGASTASATVLCENNQTSGCTNAVANGSKIAFSAENSVALKGPFSITIATCTVSNVEGTLTSAGGAAATVAGKIEKLTFESCNRQVTVNQATTGTLEVHHIAGTDNGTVTSNDTTVLIHEIPFPFPSTCAYLTSNTDIGTLTGSTTAPTFDIAATILTETEGCPNGTWEGAYKYTGTTPAIISAS